MSDRTDRAPGAGDTGARRRHRRVQTAAVIALVVAYLLVLTRADVPSWFGL